MAGRRTPEGRPTAGNIDVQVVDAAFYGRDGSVLRVWPGFRIGVDRVGHGLSMGMGAAQFIDPATGEVVRSWNPWGVLG